MQHLITLKEAAKTLGVTYARADELARQDLIPVVRLGRQVRLSPEALEDFIRGGGKTLEGGWRKESR